MNHWMNELYRVDEPAYCSDERNSSDDDDRSLPVDDFSEYQEETSDDDGDRADFTERSTVDESFDVFVDDQVVGCDSLREAFFYMT